MRARTLVFVAVLSSSSVLHSTTSSSDESGLGWGRERDGIRARLILEGGQGFPERPTLPRRYLIGDSLTAKLALKNVGPVRRAFKIKGFRGWTVSISHGAITLDPDQSDPVQIDLAPGQERVFDGPTLHLKPVTSPAGPPELPIVPGSYTVRCPLPFWIPDDADPNTSTGFNALPGTIPIEIMPQHNGRNGDLTPLSALSSKHASRPDISWGEPANGLAAGLRSTVGKRTFAADESVKNELVVKNVSDVPLTFSFSEFKEYDWHPVVTNQRGEGVQPEAIFVGGWRNQKSVTLKPGEVIAIGYPVLDINPADPTPQFHRPRLKALPGRYTEYFIVSVKPDGPPTSRVHLALVSGKLPLEVD
jgi:hypothetical protein